MRVLYLHQHFSTPAGSAGTRSYEFARRLIAAGHQVKMVCGSYGGGDTGLTGPFKRGQRRGEVDGIEVVELELPYSNKQSYYSRCITFSRYFLRCTRYALLDRYDLIFATSTPLTVSIPGVIAKALRRKPFVFEVRDLWPDVPRQMKIIRNPILLGLLSFIELVAYHSANHLISLAPGITEGIQQRGVSSSKITMIPNSSDISVFGVSKRKTHELGKEELTLLYAGTHGPANGLDSLIDTAIELKRRNDSRIKFLLVGDGRSKSNLLSRVKTESLDNVLLLPPISKNQLAELFTQADIGLQILANIPAFYFGSSPNKFFDYLAAGKPVLTNYPGWVADLIREYNCGFVVPPENAVHFADQLQQICAHKTVLGDMGANARRLAECMFSRDALAKRFVSTLESVVEI